MAAVVKLFVIDAMWNTVPVSTGDLDESSRYPDVDGGRQRDE